MKKINCIGFENEPNTQKRMRADDEENKGKNIDGLLLLYRKHFQLNRKNSQAGKKIAIFQIIFVQFEVQLDGLHSTQIKNS